MNNKQIVSMLDDIDENGEGLTDWEVEFIDSMLKESDKSIPVFSKKQKETIIKIHQRRVMA